MARKINIIEKLGIANERPFIVLEEGKPGYSVNTSYITALRIEALASKQGEEDTGVSFFDEVIKITLGKKALKEIQEMDLSTSAYQVVLEAIMAAIGGEELDSTATRFQDDEKTE